MDDLSDKVLSTLFGWLPPIDLLRSSVRVSKRFKSLIEKEEFWKFHPLALASSVALSLTTHQRQRCCLYAAYGDITATDSSSPPHDIPACLDAGSVLPTRAVADRAYNFGFRVCAASTTDQTSEVVENVLSDGLPTVGDRQSRIAAVHGGHLRWWSSRPSVTRESNETLLFATNYLALISHVKVKPLRDPFNTRQGPTCYTWKRMVIKMYIIPLQVFVDTSRMGTLRRLYRAAISGSEQRTRDIFPAVGWLDHHSIDYLLADHSPVYVSREHDIPAEIDELMTFRMPVNVIANVVSLTLIGKNHEQTAGRGYYTCIESVDCLGIPLYRSANQRDDDAIFHSIVQGYESSDNDDEIYAALDRTDVLSSGWLG